MSAVKGWKTGVLGELCSIEIGGTPSRSNPDLWDSSKDTSNRWASIRDLNRKVIDDTAEYISDLGIKHSNVKLQSPGVILLSFKLSIGRVAFAGVPLYTNEAIAGLNSKEIDLPYLFYGLQHWNLLQDVDKAIKGATLNKAKLRKIKFEYPQNKSEQTKIAEILSTVDQAIEQTEALIAKQQRIKTGLMQDLLTRGIDEHGNLRSEQTHKFKNSPLGRIPAEWAIESLATRTLIKGGKRLPAGHAYAEGDTKYRYLQTTDFIGKPLNYNAMHYLSAKTFRILERYEITDGEIFISIAGMNLGIAGVFRSCIDDRTILTENAAKISMLTEDLPEYIAMQINGPIVQRQILEDKGIGAGVPKLALFRIQQFLLFWPQIFEQQQIVHRLQLFDATLQELKDNHVKLRSLKQALMQDLLTGKKWVNALLSS